MSKECPKPRDYSRVKCSQCGEMGHTKVRCKAEPAPVDEPTFDTPEGNGGGGFGDSLSHQNGDSFTPASVAATAAPEPEPQAETDANDNWGTNDNVDW
ncbi:uncharacterized protein F4812DRAFT_384018 [Daldinia caldariorum]|uniref:uncharacterized protein n=1 Tax=Daldinia caldariorum TaxID=326644 RepID=UPI002007296B|nr:uncharacterized protein F4812DRAFT_384018 [Daldinia caldariorum]KAI1467959.1 hypothetical protein F4812DRAFT_384018 [Daldinia caldariorum]